jgi:hypothetical protein
MKKTGLLAYSAFAVVMTSCLKDKTTPVDPTACGTIVSYSADIQPIINNSCVTNQGPGTGCHDAWIFEYDNVKNYLDLGLWQTEVLIDRTMPEIPNAFGIDSLTPDEYTTMKCWIDQGYAEN